MNKFIYLFLICCVLSGSCIACSNELPTSQHIQLPNGQIGLQQLPSGPILIGLPNGMMATYEWIDRELTLLDFQNIKVGMTYMDLNQIVGKENGIANYNFEYHYYELLDGQYLLFYINPNDTLGEILLVYPNGESEFLDDIGSICIE